MRNQSGSVFQYDGWVDIVWKSILLWEFRLDL